LTHTPNLCDSHECLIDVADKANNGLLLVREKRVGGVIYDMTAESLSQLVDLRSDWFYLAYFYVIQTTNSINFSICDELMYSVYLCFTLVRIFSTV